jgi:hypothetical protein
MGLDAHSLAVALLVAVAGLCLAFDAADHTGQLSDSAAELFRTKGH